MSAEFACCSHPCTRTGLGPSGQQADADLCWPCDDSLHMFSRVISRLAFRCSQRSEKTFRDNEFSKACSRRLPCAKSAAMPGDTTLGLQLLLRRSKFLVMASSSTLHLRSYGGCGWLRAVSGWFHNGCVGVRVGWWACFRVIWHRVVKCCIEICITKQFATRPSPHLKGGKKLSAAHRCLSRPIFSSAHVSSYVSAFISHLTFCIHLP